MSAIKSVLFLVAGSFFAVAGVADDAAWFKVRGGSWETDPEVILRMQHDLQAGVARLAGRRFNDFRHWWEYKFQYQGRLKDTGPYVFISALCSTHRKAHELAERFIVVDDGGTCFFQVNYDPKAQRFYDLIINSDA